MEASIHRISHCPLGSRRAEFARQAVSCAARPQFSAEIAAWISCFIDSRPGSIDVVRHHDRFADPSITSYFTVDVFAASLLHLSTSFFYRIFLDRLLVEG